MTITMQTLLSQYQVRKSKKQKAAFLEWIIPLAQSHGYTVTTEKGSFGAKNIVFGDIHTANVVFTAHYDTCATFPFPNFITPINLPLYLMYQVVLTLGIFIVAGIVAAVCAFSSPLLATLAYTLTLWAIILLMILGPANKNTANDNTSGVATVLEMMETMPEHLRSSAAFVLFDLEEAGLIGSSSFWGHHKRIMKEKLLINFDCVSDGDHLLFCIKKKAQAWLPQLERAYVSSGEKQVELCTKGFFYPSDQANFPCGIGVAALKKGPFGILYMDRIHTKRDTIFQEENIRLLARSSVRLAEVLATK